MTSYLDHVIVTPNDSSATGVNVWRQDQGGVLELRRYVDLSFLILFIGVANFLAVPHLARIFLVGACCADDAYFAVIARRLAETGQYGFPTSDSATTMFDPLIGSGPVHIAAGALGILLLGPSRWVPSLVTMVHFGTLLAIYLWILRRRFTNAIFYGTALVLTAIATASYHGYFSLFVGEAPMLGYLVLGTACLAMWRPAADRWLVAGGLALSFALLTKPIALFPTLGILAAWLLIAIVARRRMAVLPAAIVAAAVALPLAAFETAKFFVLGPAEYAGHWQQFIKLSREFNVFQGDRLAGFIAGLSNYNLGISEVAALAVAFAITVVVSIRGVDDENAALARRLFLLLLAGAVSHLLYMLLISRMTPRYNFPGVLLLAFAIPIPLLILQVRYAAVCMIALLALVATPAKLETALRWTQRDATGRYIVEQDRVLNLLADHPNLPLVGQTWHSVYDIVYLLPRGRAWFTTNNENDVPTLNAIVVFNRFVADGYAMPNDVRAACQPALRENTIYEVYVCGSGKSDPVAE